MMTRSRSRQLKRTGFALASVPFAATMLVSAPVVMAQQDSGAATLEEIIVTATKRAENLQDVPESIVALGTEQLEQLHVQDFNDYVKLLPSVSYESFGPGFSRVFMRGVVSGDNGNHSGPLPSVGMYLDEQPITTITGALDLHIYDIERVEALAGPQGTLYGASSEAGTVRIITNKPDPSGFKAGYSLEGNAISHGGIGGVAEGFVNMPLGSRAAVRLVGWVERDAGYIDNVRGTRTYPTSGITIDNAAVAKKDYNPVDVVGGRAALRVDLNDSWTVTPGVIYQKEDTKGIFAFDPNVGELEVTHFFPEKSTDAFTQASLTIKGRIANLDLVYAGALLNRNDQTHNDYTDYSFFYDQCCGYGAYAFDNDGNLISPSQHIIGKDHYTKQSHELRVSTSKDNRLRFVGGLFMQRQLHGIEQRYMIDGLTSDYWVTAWPDTLWLTEQERVDRDYAAYGELSFDVTDQLTFTGGIRFFKSKNSLKGFFGFGQGFSPTGTGEAKCFDPPDPTPGGGINGAPCTNLDKTVDQTGSTPKFNLTYHIDDDRMVYATFSKGFRPGGVNRRGDFPPYKPDFLTNYELGWKTSWAGNRLRFNGAVFDLEWKNFQFSYLGANGLTNVTNAGAARIRGLETSLQWAASRDLMVSAGLTVLDPKLAKPFCLDITITMDECAQQDPPDLYAGKGTVLPVTPKVKGNLTARYVFPVGGFEGNVQGTYVYQGSSRSALLPSESAILGKQEAFGTLDLSAGLERGAFGYEVFVTNLFDERAAVGRYAECATAVCGAQSYFVPNEPRLIGLRLSQKF